MVLTIFYHMVNVVLINLFVIFILLINWLGCVAF